MLSGAWLIGVARGGGVRAVAIACALGATASFAQAAGPASWASAPANAEFTTIVRPRLQLAAVLKGEFEQSKTLEGFKNPLVSHGEFVVARGQGVWWHTQQPFESTLVVTKTRLFTRAADGSATNVMDAQTEPGLRQVNELVFSLLGGDLDALAEHFVVTAQSTGGATWSAVLTPRDANVAKFLSRATLTGDRYVQTVRIEEVRGDATQIRFSHQAPSAALTAEDAARFQ